MDVMQSGLTPLIPLVLLAPLLIRVAYCDLRYMKIPNALSLAALALFIVSSPLIGWEEAGWRLSTAAIVFGLGFVAFAFGLFGGGDVKMLGALLLFIPSQSLTVYAYCFSASMLVGIGVLLLIRALPQSRESNWLGIKSVGAFPMGISIALSGLVFPFVVTFPAA